MRKALLFTLCFTALSSIISAQSLQNSSWRGYWFTPFEDSIDFIFGTDTLTIKNSSGSDMVLSTFTVNGDTLVFTDVSGPDACQPSEMGTYTFAIVNDTLSFTTVTDPCSNRSIYYPNSTYRRLSAPTSGISGIKVGQNEVVVWPNPGTGPFQLKLTEASQVDIFDVNGQLTYRDHHERGTHTIRPEGSPGIYLVRVRSRSFIADRKLIILE